MKWGEVGIKWGQIGVKWGQLPASEPGPVGDSGKPPAFSVSTPEITVELIDQT